MKFRTEFRMKKAFYIEKIQNTNKMNSTPLTFAEPNFKLFKNFNGIKQLMNYQELPGPFQNTASIYPKQAKT